MKKILSERNLVVILFLAALTVFSFAQEDAKKIEKMSQSSEVSAIVSQPKQSAHSTNSDKTKDAIAEIK